MFALGLFGVLRARSGQPWRIGRDFAVPLSMGLSAVALCLLCLWGALLLLPNVSSTGIVGSISWCSVLTGLVWVLVVGIPALTAWLMMSMYRQPASDTPATPWDNPRLQAWLDLVLPFAVLTFCVGLIWGLQADVLYRRLEQFSKQFGQVTNQIRVILTFGIPAVLCYLFAERPLRFGLSVAAIMLASVFTTSFHDNVIFQERSFFGVLSVEKEGNSRKLVHGTTLHGRQFTRPDDPFYYQLYPEMSNADTWPLTYYHRNGPIGHVCAAYNEPTRNIGVIGLGTGTMASYAQKDQNITFYDIDPVVRKITFNNNTYFTFIDQARQRGANVHDLVFGDARLTLERQNIKGEEKYHILVVDAFSSDAIPIHLITYEALELYLSKMADDGIICFHISNRYLNLKPVLGNLAAKYRREKQEPLVGYYMEDAEDLRDFGKAASTWAVLARDPKYLARLGLYDSWDLHMGLEKPDTEDTLDSRLERYDAMQQQVAAAFKKLKDDPTLKWDQVKPKLKWDKARPGLELWWLPASALEPEWLPLPVDPSKGEWTDDYAPIFRVFNW
jgi:hypothetical protein